MSGRFADRAAIEWLPLGRCQCPKTTHPEGDRAAMRLELTGAEWATVMSAALTGNTGRGTAIFVDSWNITDEKGEPLPTSAAEDLDFDSFQLIDEWIKKTHRKTMMELVAKVNGESPPNRRGARSRNGSKASASLIPTTPPLG